MMTSFHGYTFRITGPLWAESTSHRCIPSYSRVNRVWSFLLRVLPTWTNGVEKSYGENVISNRDDLQRATKDKPLNNDMLKRAWFLFSCEYVHLNLDLSKGKYQKEMQKNVLWHGSAPTWTSTNFSNAVPDWATVDLIPHWMGRIFLATVSIIPSDSLCLLIPFARLSFRWISVLVRFTNFVVALDF